MENSVSQNSVQFFPRTSRYGVGSVWVVGSGNPAFSMVALTDPSCPSGRLGSVWVGLPVPKPSHMLTEVPPHPSPRPLCGQLQPWSWRPRILISPRLGPHVLHFYFAD